MTIKTIDQLLQNAYRQSDHATVQVTLTVPLRILRQHHELFETLTIESIKATAATVDPEPASKPASSTKRASGKKKTKTKTQARKKSQRAPVKVTIDAVRKALAAGHNTPTSIAQALGASAKVVSTALSRYVQKGLLVRQTKGQYSLPPSNEDTAS